MDVFLSNPEATDEFAAHFARAQAKPSVIWLEGDLGAGKSAFSRAYLRELGVQGSIKSPTYTIAELYSLPDGGLAAHLDLYRLAGPEDLEFLGLPDRSALQIILIEWPAQGAIALGEPDVQIELSIHGDGRLARITAMDAEAGSWLSRFEKFASAPRDLSAKV